MNKAGYESVRISYQSSEQMARAMFNRACELDEKIAALEKELAQRDEKVVALERVIDDLGGGI